MRMMERTKKLFDVLDMLVERPSYSISNQFLSNLTVNYARKVHLEGSSK